MKNFLLQILKFITLILSIIVSFGFWFLLFWFFTGSYDLFHWSQFNKVIYVLFSFLMLGQLDDD